MNEGRIYNKGGQVMQIEESSDRQIETVVCNIISEKLSKILFSWNTSNIGEKLITEIIKNDVNQILREHENYCVKKVSERLKYAFDLKSNFNDGYALHAKQADLIDELKKKFNLK